MMFSASLFRQSTPLIFLTLFLFAPAPAALGESPGRPGTRVPPAVFDPATGERLVAIPSDWKSYHPFSERFVPSETVADDDVLMDLRTASFRTGPLTARNAAGRRVFADPDLRSFPAERVRRPFEASARDYFIVQAGSPGGVTELRKLLESAGVPILDYLPRFAYLVKLDAATLEALSQAAPVHWVGFFHPAFRVDPVLDYIFEADPEHVLKYTAHLDGDHFPDIGSVMEALEPSQLKIVNFDWTERGWLLRLQGPISDARRLATLQGCLWVERFVDHQLFNNIARTSVATTTGRGATAGPIMDVEDVWARGIRGEGQIASAADTGLSTGDLSTLHQDFGQQGSPSNPMRVIKGYALGRTTGGGKWDDNQTTGGGHGTHTSGSIVGNGFRSGSTPSTNTFPSTCFAGTAPKAQFVFQSIMDKNGNLGGIPTDLNNLFQPPYSDGARVHSNSWGAAVAGVYDTDSQNLDEFCWNNKDMVITFSAGNSGVDTGSPDGVVNTDSIGSPGTAKNCITVGASENYRPDFQYGYDNSGSEYCQPNPTWSWFNSTNFSTAPVSTDLMADNSNGMGAFSSRGPCDDSRFKPDIVAPGIAIISTRTDLNQGIEEWGDCTVPTGQKTYYLAMGGTSMSNPLSAGCATLVRQYFVDGWHANNSSVTNSSAVPAHGFNPSSALIKAVLINGAWDMAPGQYGTSTPQPEIPPKWDRDNNLDLPNNAEGYGRVDLEHSLFPSYGWGDDLSRVLEVHDVSPGLTTGNYTDYTFSVTNEDNPLIATLVWTDPYGATGSGKKLINDLDLRATAPGGTVFYPNRLNYTGGSADRYNNVEQVKVTNPTLGTWTIRVTGYAVPGNGVAGTTTQPYALVISGISCSTPSPSSIAAAQYGNNALRLTWSSVSGASEYRILRATISGGPYSQIGTSTASPYIDTNVTGGVTYYYVVKAYGNCLSRKSTEASATAAGTCNLPPTFTGLTSASSAGSANCGINLSWSAATALCGGPVNYSVYRDTASGFTPGTTNRIASGIAGTSFNDANGLASGTAYYYIVRATDTANGVEESNLVRLSCVPYGALSATTFYTENFDGWAAGSLANWVRAYYTGDANDWRGVMACTAHSGSNIFRCGGTDCTASYALSKHALARPPAITFPSGSSNTRLSFWHRWAAETSYDGFYLRISTDGSAYTVVASSAILQNTYNSTASGIGVWSGNQASFVNTIVDLDAACNLISGNTGGCSGKTVYIGFMELTDNLYNYSGWFIDDVVITANVPGSCSTTPGDVLYLTARATSGQNKLEWVNPSTNYGGTTRICRKTGSYPTGPTDGNIADVAGSAGAYGSYTDSTGLVNGTTYYYAAFARAASGAYADGKTVTSRPFATPADVKWAYSTGASALTPPGVRPGVIGTGAVYAVSNDRNLHVMDVTSTGGSWPRYSGTFECTPSAMDAPSQGRPTVIPTPVIPGVTRVAFLGTQDGDVLAFNAMTGTQVWSSHLGEVVQATPAGIFTAFGGAYNLLFAGTRNATTDNAVFALNPVNGNTAWTFNNGGGSGRIGIISSMPAVDYANRRLYFTSRARGGGSPNTVWCLDFTDSGAMVNASWPSPASPLVTEDIDASPTLYNGRLYVGTNDGKVHALNAATGAVLWTYNTGDGTPVKNFVCLGYTTPTQRIYFSTSDRIYALDENQTSNTVALASGWPVTDIASPSTPLYLIGGTYLYVGSSNGSLYEINTTTPATRKSVALGSPASAVGSPSFDVTNNLIYVGTAAGIVYAVSIPLQ
ncbi:MAG: S8 family serine peptidase [Acidobacteria bacterium]|nr:S8 family serine peptidase [Acidobacteriota bacterium]